MMITCYLRVSKLQSSNRLTINLCLPYGISNTPKGCHDKEDHQFFRMWPPDKHKDHDTYIQGCPEDENGYPADDLD